MRVREMQRPLAGMPPAEALPVPPAEAQAVAGLLAMLEGNPLLDRALMQPAEQERSYRAVSEMRRLVADTRQLLPADSPAQPLLAALSATCRKYLEEVEAWDRSAGRRHSMPAYAFYQLLGGLRQLTGLYTWRLAEFFDLEVGDRLAALFPGTRE